MMKMMLVNMKAILSACSMFQGLTKKDGTQSITTKTDVPQIAVDI